MACKPLVKRAGRPIRMVPAHGLEEQAQLSAAIHDSNDLDAIDRCACCVWMELVQDDVGAFDQQSSRRSDLRPAWAQAGKLGQQTDTILNGGIHPFGRFRLSRPMVT